MQPTSESKANRPTRPPASTEAVTSVRRDDGRVYSGTRARNTNSRPKVRPLEGFRLPEAIPETENDRSPSIGVRDRSGLSDFVLKLSEPVLYVLERMDGLHDRVDIQREFSAEYGQPLSADLLDSIIEQLDRVHFLEGPAFEAFYAAKQDEYRRGGTRPMGATALAPELHISPGSVESQAVSGHDGQLPTSPPRGPLADLFSRLLDGAEPAHLSARPQGIVAPHLDYARGGACYASAYATLRDWPPPECVVILGTNHFGRSTSVVATTNDFATPLGTTQVDVDFVARLESALGAEVDLRGYELDHLREHSVELQVAWLQHLFGADSFRIVPLLCPDPCGPTGTEPVEDHGIDLHDFARVLGQMIDEDSRDVLVVAGADLSHVGRAFGDQARLDEGFLDAVRRRDLKALGWLEVNDPYAFLRSVSSDGNSTRVCSAGCLFVLSVSRPRTTATILRYHQTVDRPTQTCVTCAAAAFI